MCKTYSRLPVTAATACSQFLMDPANDIPWIYLENNDPSVCGRLQLKAYSKDFKPGWNYPPSANKAISFEPIVPFKKVPITQFGADTPFQYGLLAQSPGFTPPTSDALIRIFRDYIDFK
jgi:hypothetical protein